MRRYDEICPGTVSGPVSHCRTDGHTDIDPSAEPANYGRRAAHRPGRHHGQDASSPLRPQTAPLLSQEQENLLAAQIRDGDPSAREALVVSNLRLVMPLARRYAASGIPFEDLVQEGNRGLLRAASDFDPRHHKARFATYATHWIRHYLRRAVVADAPMIRIPEYLLQLRSQYNRTVGELRNQEGPEAAPMLEEFRHRQAVDHLKISPSRLANLRQSMLTRLDSEEDEEGRIYSLAETLIDPHDPARELEIADDLERMHQALKELPPFEAWIIRRHFGLADEAVGLRQRGRPRRATPAGSHSRAGTASRRGAASVAEVVCAGSTAAQSFVQISMECGLSPHRVRDIATRVLKKLRRILEPSASHAG